MPLRPRFDSGNPGNYFWFWQGLQLHGSQAGSGAFSQGSQQSQAQPAVVERIRAQASASIVMRFMERNLLVLRQQVSRYAIRRRERTVGMPPETVKQRESAQIAMKSGFPISLPLLHRNFAIAGNPGDMAVTWHDRAPRRADLSLACPPRRTTLPRSLAPRRGARTRS